MEENTIDVETLAATLSASREVTLLDVRRKGDYEASPHKIPGARWRDPEKIDHWISELPAGQQTVVYCVKGGSVSQSVTERLRREGHDAVYLVGGLKLWVENREKIDDRRQ